MANSVDHDQLQHSAVSDLGLHCLLRPVCLSVTIFRVIMVLLSLLLNKPLYKLLKFVRGTAQDIVQLLYHRYYMVLIEG